MQWAAGAAGCGGSAGSGSRAHALAAARRHSVGGGGWWRRAAARHLASAREQRSRLRRAAHLAARVDSRPRPQRARVQAAVGADWEGRRGRRMLHVRPAKLRRHGEDATFSITLTRIRGRIKD